MSHQELIRRLMKTFVQELKEHVATLTENLLELERAPADGNVAELINSLFRAAHSLKGAARSVEQLPLESLSHHIEEIFAALKSGKLSVNKPLTDLLFAAVDAIELAGARLDAGLPLPADEFSALCADLAGALTGCPAHAKAPGDDHGADALPARGGRLASTSPVVTSVPERKVPPQNHPTPEHKESTAREAHIQVNVAQLDRILARGSELNIALMRYEERVRELEPLITQLHRQLHHKAELGSGAQSRADSLCEELKALAAGLRLDGQNMRASCQPLDMELQKLRMVPFSEVCDGLQRVVRDLTLQSGKQAELVVEGETLVIDRSLVSLLRKSVLQLVRNAVDHGLETPAMRHAAGKARVGQLRIRAAIEGAAVSVMVEDDGQGLDPAAITAAAGKLALRPAEHALSPEQLIFLPGISTIASVSAVSGRGVGLDVVRSEIENVRGKVRVQSQPGRFTRFHIQVPLTLTTLRTLLIRLGKHRYALDIACVQQMLTLPASALTSFKGQQRIRVDQTWIRTLSLSGMLNLAGDEEGGVDDNLSLVLVHDDKADERVALAVDEVIGIEDILLKSLGPRLRNLPYVNGAALDRSGSPVPVINLGKLLSDVLAKNILDAMPLSIRTSRVEQKHRLLVVDDSMTTRLLEENMLRDAGFEVISAGDGQQAWKLLEQPGIDLVVSDVQMPGMGGIELTEAIRASALHRELPVILLTARDSEQDRLSGMNAGADAYLVKSAFNLDELIHTIRKLLL